jgi:hypothetical protein
VGGGGIDTKIDASDGRGGPLRGTTGSSSAATSSSRLLAVVSELRLSSSTTSRSSKASNKLLRLAASSESRNVAGGDGGGGGQRRRRRTDVTTVDDVMRGLVIWGQVECRFSVSSLLDVPTSKDRLLVRGWPLEASASTKGMLSVDD